MPKMTKDFLQLINGINWKKVKNMSTNENTTPSALREHAYLFCIVSLVIVGALWKLVDWSVILSIEFGIAGIIFSGWIKKVKDITNDFLQRKLGLKEDEIKKLEKKIEEFVSKNSILSEIIDKLSPPQLKLGKEEENVKKTD